MTPSSFLETFTSITIQVGLAVVVTMVLSRFAITDRERNRLWTVCHLMVIAMFFIGVFLPHFRLFPRITSVDELDVESLLSFESALGRSVMVVWAVGSSISLLMLVVGSIRAIRILQGSKSIVWDRLPGSSSRVEIPEIAFDGNGKTSILFLTNSRLHGPFCWRIHRPIIVLPQFVLSFPADELRLVIRHEMAHLRFGHPMQLFLQRIVGTLFWFHPAIWKAARQADKYRELACDENTVSSRQEATAFLKSLIRLVEHHADSAGLTAAGLSFGGNRNFITHRAEQVSHRNWRAESRTNKPLRFLTQLQVIAACLAMLIWIPFDVTASNRTWLSPWPTWSANTLQSIGIKARDYEIDGHRLNHHKHISKRQSANIIPPQKTISESR